MCFGTQEYFTHCRHPGEFYIDSHCIELSCQSRIESQIKHKIGCCDYCSSARREGHPIGNHLDHLSHSPSAFKDVQELLKHHLPKVYAGRKIFRDATMVTGKLENCYYQSLQRDAELDMQRIMNEFRRDVNIYKADEIAQWTGSPPRFPSDFESYRMLCSFYAFQIQTAREDVIKTADALDQEKHRATCDKKVRSQAKLANEVAKLNLQILSVDYLGTRIFFSPWPGTLEVMANLHRLGDEHDSTLRGGEDTWEDSDRDFTSMRSHASGEAGRPVPIHKQGAQDTTLSRLTANQLSIQDLVPAWLEQLPDIPVKEEQNRGRLINDSQDSPCAPTNADAVKIKRNNDFLSANPSRPLKSLRSPVNHTPWSSPIQSPRAFSGIQAVHDYYKPWLESSRSERKDADKNLEARNANPDFEDPTYKRALGRHIRTGNLCDFITTQYTEALARFGEAYGRDQEDQEFGGTNTRR